MEEYLDFEPEDEDDEVQHSDSSSSSETPRKIEKNAIVISDEERQPPPASSEDNCPICLQPFETETFVDGCYHRFCLTCILQWTEIALSCPLCKAPINELIHDVTDDLQYRKINIKKFKKSNKATDTFPTAIHRKRKRIYNLNLRGTIPTSSTFVLGPKTISEKIWETRLKPWIEREAQSLLAEEDVSLLLTVVKSLLFKYAPNAPEVKNELEGWFGVKDTATFLHELNTFASAQCDVRRFDSVVEYSPLGIASVREDASTAAAAAAPTKVLVDLTQDASSEKKAATKPTTKRKTRT